ncbi:hypothetical protein KDW_64340 [Dictyobacter vulcani]|uniref:Uncharacterized protein n=1 Tax=Dictyobacter vulcani TaxID=2607529 RepID=A0A5J4KYX5_9CHLR|nr:hypothetical protein KDW_64340 [Dictyobacter vulcani]
MVGGMRFFPEGMQAKIIQLNGQPAIIGYTEKGIYGVILLEFVGTHIRNVYSIINPDKLKHLIPS